MIRPLDTLSFAPAFVALPDDHAALAGDALNMAAALGDTANPERVPGFVMSPPHVAWSILNGLRDLGAPDATFCEWGAGIGIVTFLAERAGFDAWGVELEPTLIAAGTALGHRHGVQAPLCRGSYKPDGFFSDEQVRDPALLRVGTRALFGAAITFVFAWPAETRQVQRFFARHAPAGAILILYGGGITVSALRQPPPD